MEFLNYNQVDVDTINVEFPGFDPHKGIFISGVTRDGNIICIKKVIMKLLNLNNNELELEFLYSDNNFYKFIYSLDKCCRGQIIKNASTWFGSNANEDTINNIYKNSINLPVKIPALPFMRFNYDEECKIMKKRKKLEISELKSNMELEIDFTITGIQYYKNKCNLCYSIQSIKVLNDICQSFDSLFDEDNVESNIDSETNDMTASSFKKSI